MLPGSDTITFTINLIVIQILFISEKTRIHRIQDEASVNFNIKRYIRQPYTYFAPSFLSISLSLTHTHTHTNVKHEKLEKMMIREVRDVLSVKRISVHGI